MPELAIGRAAGVEAGGVRVLLCTTASGMHALHDVCPHQALSLDGARVRGDSIICPHHGARFNLIDGRSLLQLTEKPLALLPCRMVGGEVEIEL